MRKITIVLILLVLVLMGKDTPYLNVFVPNYLWILYYPLLFLLLVSVTIKTLMFSIALFTLVSYALILMQLTSFAEITGVVIYMCLIQFCFYWCRILVLRKKL